VLHVSSGNLYGGIETFLRSVAAQRKILDDVVMDFALCFEGRIAQEIRETGATLHRLEPVRMRSPVTVFAARRSLAAILSTHRYDVAVCHGAWVHAVFAPAVRATDTALVHYVHDLPHPLRWLDRLANCTRPDLVLCNSAFTAASGDWLFPGVRRAVARLPLVTRGPMGALSRTAETGERSPRELVRQELGAADDAVVILQASRMQAWKGHETLIGALSQMPRSMRWACWIAGGSQRKEDLAYERRLHRLVEKRSLSDRVTFLGQRSDVARLMQAADIYCQPNAKPEPFGMSFVEALAAGLPVVTTRMGGALEIVTDACGALTDIDAADLAVALREIVSNDERRARLSRAGPAQAMMLCDPVARLTDLAGMLRDARSAYVDRRPVARHRGRRMSSQSSAA
jgi:glycosyltransferase involved in cell wall biosynthesis